ncbi:MAG: tetratricopeptide repeat protein [Acidobacteriota bacterium]
MLRFERRSTLRPLIFGSVLSLLILGSCAPPAGFDSTGYLRQQIAKQAGDDLADRVGIPFELDPEVLEVVEAKLKPVGDTRSRVARILDFIFRGVDLEYQLSPTLDASDTFVEQQGNCLSFVNLFVAVGRHMRLDPFYVEVEDHQRWDHREGMVVSQGHIVAGLYVDGELKTYDFLPYRVKSYKEFEPIDDLTAAAHFYNNLGAEALLAGEVEAARGHLETATRIDPSFVKAANNLGVWHSRQGQSADAVDIYRKALEVEPGNVPLLTNLARAYQQLGQVEEAEALLAQVEGVQHRNPFFFIYKGEAALARGETEEALAYMRDGLRADTETPEVHLGLTKVYVALGELRKAKHHLERALRLDATHPEAARLARMLEPTLRGEG